MTPDDLTAEMFWSIVALVAVVYLAFEGAVWLGQRYAATDRGGEGAEQVLDPTPDLTACDHRCANIARTEEHITALRAELDALQEEHDSPMTPDPLRHRIRAQIDRREAIVTAHRDEQEEGGRS